MARVGQLGGQSRELLAHPQLGILQPQRRQPRGVQRMPHLARVLQDEHARTAGQAGDQRTQAMAGGALAAGHWERDMGADSAMDAEHGVDPFRE